MGICSIGLCFRCVHATLVGGSQKVYCDKHGRAIQLAGSCTDFKESTENKK